MRSSADRASNSVEWRTWTNIRRLRRSHGGVDITGKKILVTGADGFIGSHLTEALVRAGCDVRALVLYNSFNSWGWLDHLPAEVRADLEVVSGDVRDPYGVRRVMQ